jgi:para-nitrobenzyl esterase
MKDELRPVVTTAAGQVRGCTDGPVLSFKGIPFAAPPVGPLRFRPPADGERWDGILDASRFAGSCPQPEFSFEGSPIKTPPVPNQTEDCLYLNVWTPDLGARLPVLVWIHGGAFIVGTSATRDYDGGLLAGRGAVVVTINYRLGPFGYLHLGDEEGAGGFGTLDQIAALRWVRENIEAFGGDPDRVTVFGESAGGMSVGTLLGMPAARGLFHRAIAQSGAASTSLMTATAHRVTGRFLELVGAGSADRDTLEGLDVAAIVAATDKLRFEVLTDPTLLQDDYLKGMGFLPVHGTETLPRRALDAVRDGAGAGVDLLVGTNADEMRLFTHVGAMGLGMNRMMVEVMHGPLFAGAGRSVSAVLDAYFARRPGAPERDVLSAYQTDQTFRIPAMRLAEARAPHGAGTWMYRFTWATPVLDGQLRACHGLDIPFIFGRFDGDVSMLVGEDPPMELCDAMQEAWVAFATDGVPRAAGLPEWPRYEPTHRRTMELGTPSSLVDDPDAEERVLWDGLLD